MDADQNNIEELVSRLPNDEERREKGGEEQVGEKGAADMDADQIHKIEELVGRLPNDEERRERKTIYRVPYHIRESCKNYFEPRVVSIGPYHHGRPHLQAMEELKKWYLAEFLSKSARSVGDFINVLTPLEPEARRCYFESVEPIKEKFVAMLLLDGCFIIELLRRSHDIRNSVVSSDEEINNSLLPEWIKALVRTDLLMLENQIPYTILKSLYPYSRPSLGKIIISFFFEDSAMAEDLAFGKNFDHLLHFYHHYFVPHMEVPRTPLVSIEVPACPIRQALQQEPGRPINQQGPRMVRLLRNCFIKRIMDGFISAPGFILRVPGFIFYTLMATYIRLFLYNSFVRIDSKSTSSIRCAIDLQEFGVSIREKSKPTSFLNVTFQSGSLLIPRTVIDKATRSNYINLVAFEQSSDRVGVNKELTSYAVFMNCLISNPKDLLVLQRENIIESRLLNDEQVVLFFNDLSACAYNYHNEDFKALFKDTNCYCKKHYPSLRANFFHNFHNSPWKIITGIIAVILLFLSVYQVVICSANYFNLRRPR